MRTTPPSALEETPTYPSRVQTWRELSGKSGSPDVYGLRQSRSPGRNPKTPSPRPSPAGVGRPESRPPRLSTLGTRPSWTFYHRRGILLRVSERNRSKGLVLFMQCLVYLDTNMKGLILPLKCKKPPKNHTLPQTKRRPCKTRSDVVLPPYNPRGLLNGRDPTRPMISPPRVSRGPTPSSSH